MKKLLYAIVFSLPTIFFSCQETEIPENPPAASADDVDYFYETSVVDSSDHGFIETFVDISVRTDSYPDSAWTVTITEAPGSGTWDESLTFEIETEGQFEFAIYKEWFSYQDSIWGTGYFDADTLYMEYDYQEQDSGNMGHVSIHSL